MKKFTKIVIMVMAIFLLTGCTRMLRDEDNNVVQNPETNQNLARNILCQPTDSYVRELYEENNINLEELPECQDLTVVGSGDDGLWTNVFIKPLATIIINIYSVVGNIGLGIILTAILLRIVFIPLTKKTALQSEHMKNAKPELDALNKKFKGKTDQESMMKKNQQMMAIYKKHDVNPITGCLAAFIQLPIFLAFFETINRVPALFEGSFLSLNLGMTPLRGILDGNLLYLVLVILMAVVTYYSFNFSRQDMMPGSNPILNKNMMYILLGFIVLASFNFATAILLYWITSSAFTVAQNKWVARGRGKKDGKE